MITIDDLIQQGEKFVPHIENIHMLSIGTSDSEYENWRTTARRFLGVNYPKDKTVGEFEQVSKGWISPDNHSKLLAILKAIKTMPQLNTVPTNSGRKGGDVIVNNNNTVNQTVNQTQNTTMWCTAFIDSIKHELTGRQLQEIKEILEQHRDAPETAKSKLIEKLMSFGSNVAAGILGNLMTNPAIFSGILSGLG